MASELTAKEAILARSQRHPDLWSKNKDSDEWGEIIGQPCVKCGSRVACIYAEMGALDFDHTWAHVCLHPACDYIVEMSQHESSNGYAPVGTLMAPLTCPLCGG